MKTLLLAILFSLTNLAVASGNPDLLKINGKRVTIKTNDSMIFNMGSSAYVGRVFVEMKSRGFENSFVQLIVNGKVVKNIGVMRGAFQSYRAYLGELAQGIAVRVVSGKVRIKTVYVELSDQSFPLKPIPGYSSILPMHADVDLAYLLEDLRITIDNLRGYLEIDDWRSFSEISKLSSQALSVMNVRGDSYDNALAIVANMIEKMNSVQPIIDKMLEMDRVAHFAVNFNSLKEAIKMKTKS